MLVDPSHPTATQRGLQTRDAFELLHRIVIQQVAAELSSRSATVKQRMTKANPQFHERFLGYKTFREFLKAAEAEGVVALRATKDSPDVDVLPAEGLDQPTSVAGGVETKVGTTSASGLPHLPRGARVRSDLWRAFTQWRAGLIRFWNPEDEMAYVLPQRIVPGESTAESEARRNYAAGRVVAIEHVAQTDVLEWMREFTAGRASDERGMLEAALGADRPWAAFTATLRDRGLYSEWHPVYGARVLERILAWSTTNQLHVDPLGTYPGPTVKGAERKTDQAHYEQEVRAAAHRLIDSVPLNELLALRFTLESYLGR